MARLARSLWTGNGLRNMAGFMKIHSGNTGPSWVYTYILSTVHLKSPIWADLCLWFYHQTMAGFIIAQKQLLAANTGY